MRYSIARIGRNIAGHWFSYLVIMIDFMFGAAIFIVCRNYQYTSEALLQEFKEGQMANLTEVWYVAADDEEEDEDCFPISYQTYRELTDNTEYAEELEFLLAEKIGCTYFVFEPWEVYDIQVYFMNEPLFRTLFGMDQNEKVYIGSKAYEYLSAVRDSVNAYGTDNVLLVPHMMELAESETILFEGSEYPGEMFDAVEQDLVDSPYADQISYDFSDAVIFPISTMELVSSEEQYGLELHGVSYLYFKYKNANWREDLVPRVLQKLTDDGRGCSFHADNVYLDFKKQIDDLANDSMNWFVLSVSILLLAGVGAAGLMFLLLQERKHLFAVSIAYGATYRRLMVESLMEVGSVLVLGGIAGLLLAGPMRRILLYEGELHFDYSALVILIGMIIVYSLLSVLGGMRAVEMKNVALSIRDE